MCRMLYGACPLLPVVLSLGKYLPFGMDIKGQPFIISTVRVTYRLTCTYDKSVVYRIAAPRGGPSPWSTAKKKKKKLECVGACLRDARINYEEYTLLRWRNGNWKTFSIGVSMAVMAPEDIYVIYAHIYMPKPKQILLFGVCNGCFVNHEYQLLQYSH